MSTVLRSDLSNLRMVAGNEKKYNRVVDGNMLLEWVGIGWCKFRVATARDKAIYPTVVEKELV